MLGEDRKGYWRRWLRTMVREVGQDDPAALRQLIELRDELNAMIPEAARSIHLQGYSWADIAADLGCSRVTAFQRFAAKPDRGVVVDVVETRVAAPAEG